MLCLKKKQKQAMSTLCMKEMWMVYRCLKTFFYGVVKVQNNELTKRENQQFQACTERNPFLKKASHC